MLIRVYAWVRHLLTQQEGQGLLEYGLIISLIAVAAFAGVSALGSALEQSFQEICEAVARGLCS